jgi:uridine kinase
MFVKKKEPFLIGVAGGISSGKSSCCKKIIEELGQLNSQNKKHILVISLDSFYRKLSNEDRSKAERAELNLDHPEAFDEELAYQTLLNLIQGKSAKIPNYCKKSYGTIGDSQEITPDIIPDVLIIEGILVFYYPKIRDLCQMKLFVDCDADTRLSRRVLRDMKDFNRPLDNILNYYQKYVKPAFEEFCLPTKKYADVIIPRGAENTVALNLIVQHINDYLNSTRNNSSQNNYSEPVSVKTSFESPKSSVVGGLINASPQSSQSSSPSTPSKRIDISMRPH